MHKNSMLVGFVVGVSSDMTSPVQDQYTLAAFAIRSANVAPVNPAPTTIQSMPIVAGGHYGLVGAAFAKSALSASRPCPLECGERQHRVRLKCAGPRGSG